MESSTARATMRGGEAGMGCDAGRAGAAGAVAADESESGAGGLRDSGVVVRDGPEKFCEGAVCTGARDGAGAVVAGEAGEAIGDAPEAPDAAAADMMRGGVPGGSEAGRETRPSVCKSERTVSSGARRCALTSFSRPSSR